MHRAHSADRVERPDDPHLSWRRASVALTGSYVAVAARSEVTAGVRFPSKTYDSFASADFAHCKQSCEVPLPESWGAFNAGRGRLCSQLSAVDGARVVVLS